MPIDLGDFPSYRSSLETGRTISRFGEVISGLGAMLGRIPQTQQAFLNLQVAKEIITAKDICSTGFNEFNKQLAVNPDYETQGEASEKFIASLYERIQEGLTTEESRLKFHEWYVGEKDKQTKYVNTEIRKRTIASAQATIQLAAQNAVVLGDVQSIIEIGKTAVRGGILSGEQYMSLAKELIPQARYNAVSKELLDLQDYDQALDIVAQADFGESVGLDPGQVERMTRDLQFRKTNIDNATKAELEASQETTYQDFLKKTRSATDMADLSLDDLINYRLNVGSKYGADVQRFIDKMIESEEQKQIAKLELDQDIEYSHQSAELLEWDGTGKSPWNLGDLTTWVREKRITVEQRNQLEADFKATKDELAKGERTPEQMRQNRNSSDIKGSMYTALDQLKDPRAVVSVRDINAALDGGRISIAQRDDLLDRREQLGKDYEARLEADKKSKGPWHDDPATEAKLWEIVLNPKLSSTEKFDKARQFRGAGVPPDKWYDITSHIEELNNRPDWKSRMDALNSFYNAIINAVDKADPERKAAALEKAFTAQALLKIFRQYPDAPDKWDEALQSLLNPATKRELHRMLQSKLQARFGGLLAAPEWETLETAREQLPAEFAASPGLQMQQAIKGPEIAENEQKILEGAGIKIADRYQAPSGEWIYSTVLIPRDENGQPRLEELRKAGNLYTVRSMIQGGRITQQAMRAR